MRSSSACCRPAQVAVSVTLPPPAGSDVGFAASEQPVGTATAASVHVTVTIAWPDSGAAVALT